MDEKMNPEVKALWLAALESGEYAQCQGTLTRVDPVNGSKSYCCLGVLTELAVEAGMTEQTRVSSLGGIVEYDNACALLPPRSVQEWAGLPDDNPVVNYHGERHLLAELNDTFGLEFPEIAAIIREQL